jgi:SNF2 family DNA or RNA helicase
VCRVKVAVLNGNMSYEERTAQVHLFDTDDTVRVIIISNAGANGLNLNRGSTIIIFVSAGDEPRWAALALKILFGQDHFWSDVLGRQVRGRSHRLGQKETVIIIYITALETTDIMMGTMAASKGAMFNAFLERGEQNKGKQHCLSLVTMAEFNSVG